MSASKRAADNLKAKLVDAGELSRTECAAVIAAEYAPLEKERNRFKLALSEIMSVDQSKPSAAARMGEIADRALSVAHIEGDATP